MKLKDFLLCAIDRELMPRALKVSLLVGSILFTINHGSVLLKGQMTRERWIAGLLTYIVPYGVSLHGQCVSRSHNKIS
ncbi:nitrate/nitrite transporter NrtS [Geminocystis sp. CENA526]|uniref:nitrate/nitrite transporter NrtS n=1 Tax=Geminocystis sp. CENA526 TaxID=1355871 RepID=UPI003D6F778C